MSLTARDYLVDRFRTDAQVLRDRAAALTRGAAMPGPDATTSMRMAEACDDVIAMLQAMATDGDPDAAMESLLALVPLLERRAQQQTLPPVRAVYAGAATRIREVRAVELGGAEDGA